MKLARMIKLYIDTTGGMSQKQVAQETGVNESTLSRFLSGEQMPASDAFARLLSWCLTEHVATTITSAEYADLSRRIDELGLRTFGSVRLGGKE